MRSFEDPAPLSWHVSSYSGGQGGCVEVAEGCAVLVRDTKHRQHGHLSFDHQAWAHLLNTLQRRR